jgi:hypothetical protein
MQDVMMLYSDYMSMAVADHVVVVVNVSRRNDPTMRTGMDHVMMLNSDYMSMAIADHVVVVVNMLRENR